MSHVKTDEALLQVRGLKKHFGHLEVLRGIDIDIHKGEVVAVIGPSGSGKSTFIRCLNRLEEPTAGEVIFEGQQINTKNADIDKIRQKIGMVFQQPNPFPMSIYDNVAYGPRIHGIKNKAQLDAIVEQSLKGAALWDEVSDRLKKSALGLSGGQQQRLCIARALAVEPDILLMDEATSALDPISTSKIEDLIADLKQKYTIVIVTHNMQQATRVSDKCAFFLLGQLIEFGDTTQLFSMPRDKRTEDYITGRFG